jgi:hypothetical protein
LKLLKSKDENDSSENMPRGQDNNAHHIGVKVLSKNDPIALDKALIRPFEVSQSNKLTIENCGSIYQKPMNHN